MYCFDRFLKSNVNIYMSAINIIITIIIINIIFIIIIIKKSVKNDHRT